MLEVETQLRRGTLELDVALDVPAGRCLALAGPSGAGKTSLLRIVAGLLRPQRGRVALDGRVWLDTTRGHNLAPERRRCGFVFQDYALFGHLSAWRNVAYGLPRHRRRRARAHELLERFGIAALADRRPAELSGGERQRLAVARALAAEPQVLLLDEPLAALDRRAHASAARELALTLRASGAPTLLVTHDFADAAALGDEVGVIDGGRLVQRGDPARLAAEPASAFVADFAGAVVLPGMATPGPDGLTKVALDGGGSVLSPDRAEGPVAASIYPWEIALEPAGVDPAGSARNVLAVEVTSVTPVANRVRVGLAAPQPLAAEVTEGSARQLALARGVCVTATWKATATRLVKL